MARDNEVPLEFPLGGLDVTKEFQLQPPGTTPAAVNVRATDTLALRRRGGSRPGLVKYIAEQFPGWTSGEPLQHLNVIVDPTTDALPQNFTTPDDTWVEHPRFPGVFVPPGGGGDQPNPNVAQDPPPGEDITFYQTFSTEFEPWDGEKEFNFELHFTLEVETGHTIVIAVMTNEASPGTSPDLTLTVTNGVGAAYTRVGSALGNLGYNRFTGDNGQEHTLSLWYKRVATEDDKVFKITPSDDGQRVFFRMAEYDNMDPVSTLGDFSFDSDAGSNLTLSTGPFDSGGAKYATIAAYVIDRVGSSSGPTFTPMAGYTRRGAGGIGSTLYFIDDVDTGLSLNLDIESTVDAACAFCGIGASFQPE